MPSQKPRIEYAVVPVSELELHPDNARRGNVEAIKASLRAHGPYRPLVVGRRTRQVLAGNHTLLAARELDWETMPVCFIDVDQEQARRILLADNRTSDRANYDLEALVELLGALPDLEGTGYDGLGLFCGARPTRDRQDCPARDDFRQSDPRAKAVACASEARVTGVELAPVQALNAS